MPAIPTTTSHAESDTQGVFLRNMDCDTSDIIEGHSEGILGPNIHPDKLMTEEKEQLWKHGWVYIDEDCQWDVADDTWPRWFLQT